MGRAEVTPLGAGRDVGRSCIVVRGPASAARVVLDCGVHLGVSGARRFPDLAHACLGGSGMQDVACVVVTHFHLDHCGGVPFLMDTARYAGPVVMTSATRDMALVLLDDFCSLMAAERENKDAGSAAAELALAAEHAPGSGAAAENGALDAADARLKAAFAYEMGRVRAAFARVTLVEFGETVCVAPGVSVTLRPAGHVLGAATAEVRVGGAHVVYTGDVNTVAQRHVGAASFPRLAPDLLITESTYGTLSRPCKRRAERSMLQAVHECVLAGGRVLVPASAVGRLQELCTLLDRYWARSGLRCPLYYAQGLGARATAVQAAHPEAWGAWAREAQACGETPFSYRHAQPWSPACAEAPGPAVVMATPGLMQGGTSLELFRKWAGDESTLVVLPGESVPGTLAHRALQAGRGGSVRVSGSERMRVHARVIEAPMSAHADAPGLVRLAAQCAPRAVALVHGEERRMEKFAARLRAALGVPCTLPAGGETLQVDVAGGGSGGSEGEGPTDGEDPAPPQKRRAGARGGRNSG